MEFIYNTSNFIDLEQVSIGSAVENIFDDQLLPFKENTIIGYALFDECSLRNCKYLSLHGSGFIRINAHYL